MNKTFIFLKFLVIFYFFCGQAWSQYVKVMVAPDHPDWTYQVNEEVKFKISVSKFGHPYRNVKVDYEINPEKMKPRTTTSVILPEGTTIIPGGTMKQPGFLRCTAKVKFEGKEYSGFATAGFSPLNINPTIEMPKDFIQFWQEAKEAIKKIPLDAKTTLIPERCTATVDVYHVNIQNDRIGSRLYGILCVPKKEGKYSALLNVPGAGVRPYYGMIEMAEKGMITFQIGIHGIPVTLDNEVYNNLRQAALNGYWLYNLDNRDRYYYKRVYLGCVRAVDFIFSLPEFDGVKLAVTGGSQGGALSIVTAALDSRVKWLAAYYPALCDLTGYLHNRAGGWPHMFSGDIIKQNNREQKVKTAGYYDVVNFARTLKIPGYYSWGFNDRVCPPTTMYAAYNVIKSAKKLFIAQDTGHWAYPEQYTKSNAWLLNCLVGEGDKVPK